MRRIGNLYQRIISIENLILSDKKASKGKQNQYGVKVHRLIQDENILKLHESLKGKTHKTSPYTIFKIYEPKERDVYRLPYYPDRITHHAILNILEPIFVSVFTNDTYSCIKGKGIHAAANSVKESLKDVDNTKYALKLDVKKFYPNIDHDILKKLLRRKIKDNDLLDMLDEIIESAVGVPIGNYLSQYFANFYLTYFDHWIKENKAVKYYFRYADDIVILSDSKPYLHDILFEIKKYLSDNLKLIVKDNYQIFPVDSRGLDFVGYRFYHSHTMLRKGIKKRFIRMLAHDKNDKSIASYNGWLKHANCINLKNKITLM